MCIGRCATEAGVMFNASDGAVPLHGLQVWTREPDHLLSRIAKGSCQHIVAVHLVDIYIRSQVFINTQSSQVSLRGTAKRLEYQLTGSRLEAQFLLWELARQHLSPRDDGREKSERDGEVDADGRRRAAYEEPAHQARPV